MKNAKTPYEYQHTDGNWYPIEIRRCSMARARGTVNEGRPYQPVYIKDGREHTIRYRRTSIRTALDELQHLVERIDGTSNGKRYRMIPVTAEADTSR